ncbi:MAG: hypothetical protein G01um101438_639 [Parcubacteria group bacterium Gr01-1014_38]|nr:MAG: hypothetical protein G01um101438_639 [Parcubacteria group bacterium Gr01-1014_38]
MPDNRPPAQISLIAVLLFTPYLAVLDGVNVLLLFVGMDDFWITDVLAFPITQLYLRFKGVRSTYNIVCNIVELIPYVGALPLKTVGFLLTVWANRRAARRETLEQVEAGVRREPRVRTGEAARVRPAAAAGGSAARVLR